MHVYMELDVINSDYTQGSSPQLGFEEVRNAPFLEGDASEYVCCVVRFSIQTGNTLPVLVPRVKVGQSDKAKTVHTITMIDYTTIGSSPIAMSAIVDITYKPKGNRLPRPAPTITQQDLSSDYHYIYTYPHRES